MSTEENVTPQVENKNSEPKLEIQDIVNAINIIDLCASRGAFRGEELLKIGEMRTRFSEFITSAENRQQ